MRFDDRRPPRGKDGDDFQTFVWEALTSGYFAQLSVRYIRPYFSAGNDGAIDHLAIGGHDQIVFEAKFFGKTRKGSPGRDWVDLSKTLHQNLTANALRAFADVDRLYKPWFDTDRPIKGYWFCTSGILTPGAQTELRDSIKTFFAGFGNELSLAHLAAIDVEVLDWNDFSGVLTARRSLDFR